MTFITALEEALLAERDDRELPDPGWGRNSLQLTPPQLKKQLVTKHGPNPEDEEYVHVKQDATFASLYKDDNGALYALASPPYMDGGEWWVRAKVVRLVDGKLETVRVENFTVAELLPQLQHFSMRSEHGMGWLPENM